MISFFYFFCFLPRSSPGGIFLFLGVFERFTLVRADSTVCSRFWKEFCSWVLSFRRVLADVFSRLLRSFPACLYCFDSKRYSSVSSCKKSDSRSISSVGRSSLRILISFKSVGLSSGF